MDAILPVIGVVVGWGIYQIIAEIRFRREMRR